MNCKEEKPLFVPLNAHWFEEFEAGRKDEEIRIYGPKWNEETCRIGRPVVLSYGYGKARRMNGVIVGFRKKWGPTLPYKYMKPIVETFGDIRQHFSLIKIRLDENENS